MITRSNAISALKKIYPNKKIIETWIYKNSSYIFNAVDNEKEISDDETLFLVDSSGRVRSFLISEDYDGFMRARRIK